MSRINGATKTVLDGITFRSLLEKSCYKHLKESGLSFEYEPERFMLWEGFKPTITILSPKKMGPGRYGKELEKQTKALIGIRYTPDFLVIHDHYRIYFDVKGKENDIYPLKKKMFLKYLEEHSSGALSYIFVEPHSVKQMVQAIEWIKTL